MDFYDIITYKLFDFKISVGLQKILQLLTSEDLDIQIHAVKLVANLAAEGAIHLPYNVSVDEMVLAYLHLQEFDS